MNNNKIINLIPNPVELESLYHNNPKQFKVWLKEAIIQSPASETLKVWDARINYSFDKVETKNYSKLILVIILSLISFFLIKLQVITSVSEEWYYPRFASIIVFGSLIFYFLDFKTKSLRHNITIISGIVLCTIIMILLPDKPKSASITMAQIHLPLVLVALLALAFMSKKWKSSEAKLSFIKYAGETFVYSTLILLGGMVLTALTVILFNLIGINAEQWYLDYVVIWGCFAAPIVATYIYDKILYRKSKLATLIANIFAPLFLITIIVYISAIFFAQKSPFTNRDSLITFNGLLILVWGISVFSITGKILYSSSKITDIVNISLIALTLIINSIALSAIMFRLSEFGITPNRVAVIGANTLIFIHLVGILVVYIKLLKNKTNKESLVRAIANYLPVYSIWALLVVIALPLIFNFK